MDRRGRAAWTGRPQGGGDSAGLGHSLGFVLRKVRGLGWSSLLQPTETLRGGSRSPSLRGWVSAELPITSCPWHWPGVGAVDVTDPAQGRLRAHRVCSDQQSGEVTTRES